MQSWLTLYATLQLKIPTWHHFGILERNFTFPQRLGSSDIQRLQDSVAAQLPSPGRAL